MFLAKKLNKGAGSPAAPADAQFNYVTMLLHGDGTNGAQNNTFLDSSTNNFTITRNGNTTQGSFSPYGSNWSNYFNGSTDYLTAPSSAAFSFGTGDYTVEAWVFAKDTAYNGITEVGGAFFGVYLGKLAYYEPSTALISSSMDVPLNTWTHIAFSRSSGTLKLFVNGVLGSSTTANTNLTGMACYIGIGVTYGGPNFNGYISNLRIVKGTAVYTSAFTPSTVPLTAISGTSVLTCQSNRFIDNSANNFTLTVTGTPSVQRFNPFGASTAYSTSVIGGSGYFDGSGDYLSVSTGTALNLNSGDFTIEGWVYPTDTIGYYTIFSNGDYPSTAQVVLMIAAAPILYMSNGSGWTISLSSSINININEWNHIAVTASGTTYTIWVNGVSGGSATNGFTRTSPASTSVIGRLYVSTNDYYAKGYISNVRVVKGTALYTTTFTPSTTPLTAVSNTQLLLGMTNGAIYDNAMMNDLETVGNAQISTSVVKYGTGSMYFDGTGDYLSILNTPVSTPSGTESWTIEGWVYRTTSGAFQAIYVNGYPIQIYLNINTIEIYISSTNGFSYIVNGLTGPLASIALNTWAHFAVVRNGSNFTVYVNGVGGITVSSSTAIAFPSNANATIGDAPLFGAYGYTGYIDDLRITKGYARYNTNFTPPTAAFPNTGPL